MFTIISAQGRVWSSTRVSRRTGEKHLSTDKSFPGAWCHIPIYVYCWTTLIGHFNPDPVLVAPLSSAGEHARVLKLIVSYCTTDCYYLYASMWQDQPVVPILLLFICSPT